MAKFLRIWNTVSNRNEALSPTHGTTIVGKEFRVLGDGQAIVVDAVSGVTIVSTGLEDRFLAQITASNKVAGSAVELAADGSIYNNSGLGVKYDADMFSIDSTSGLVLDYNTSHFQFIPGTGLSINAVPNTTLESTVVFTDGSRPFTAAQGGVDAVANSDITTLGQVNSLIAAAISGDFSQILINLAGQSVLRGQCGYVEATSGAFRLAKADSPSTAKVQYICVATTSVADGASGSFQNPSLEVNNIANIVSGFNKGDFLWLSSTEAGMYQNTPPSVSGETIYPTGWMQNHNTGLVFFPGEALDL